LKSEIPDFHILFLFSRADSFALCW